jgi:hypothetical protein
MNDLAPLTFKITGNTSGGTPSMTGTAATSSSTNAAQPVTVNAAGSKGPDFAGVTMQYAFFSKNSVAAKALNTASVTTSGAANTYLTAVTGLLKTANQTQMDIEKCDAYQTWTQVMKSSGFQGTVEDALDAKAPAESDDELGKDLAERYSELLTSMATSKLSVCQTALSDFNGLFAAIQKVRRPLRNTWVTKYAETADKRWQSDIRKATEGVSFICGGAEFARNAGDSYREGEYVAVSDGGG